MSLRVNDHENIECLNCGNPLEDEYCQVCGQKKIPKNHGVWSLVNDFLGTYFNFDSKLSRTLLPTIIKPGFLTNEYRLGKRASYIPPIRFFIFVSIIFFLIVALLPNTDEPEDIKEEPKNTWSDEVQADTAANSIKVNKGDVEVNFKAISEVGDSLYIWDQPFPLFKSYAEYKVYREGLAKKPGFWTEIAMRQYYKLKNESNDELNEGLEGAFLDILPKLVFLVLPFFALILKLLYVRRKHYFEEHFVLTLHFHSFVFIILLIFILLSYLSTEFLIGLPLIAAVYMYIAMRKVYGQGVLKTLVKLLIIMILYGIVLLIAFLISAILAFIIV